MIKSLIIAAAALAVPAVPAVAQVAPAERTMTTGGQVFTYSVSADDRGRTVLTGRNASNGVPFRYVIDGRAVTGFTGNAPVSFQIDKPIARQAEVMTVAVTR